MIGVALGCEVARPPTTRPYLLLLLQFFSAGALLKAAVLIGTAAVAHCTATKIRISDSIRKQENFALCSNVQKVGISFLKITGQKKSDARLK